MIIAFMGPSGSGKTTVINDLKDWDNFKGKKVVISEEDDFQVIKFFKSIAGNRLFSEYKKQKFFNKKPSSLISILFSWIVYLFYPVIIYIEFISLYFIYSTIWKNRVLLCDRYIYDYLVTFEEVLNIKNPLTRFLMSNFPKPHLSIYLKISKDTSISRNKNNIKGKITTDIDLHERVLREYDKLSRRFGIVTIVTDKDLQTSIKGIKDYIYAKEKLSSIKSLSISGMDGSGKTTICNSLNVLCKQLGISSQVVHFYHLPIAYKLFLLLGFKINNRLSSVKTLSNEEILSSSKRSFIWALFTFLDSFIQYMFVRIINFNSLIIMDRYFYDYLVSFEYRKVSNTKLFANFIPRLDNSFLFMLKPDEASKRKTDNLEKDYFQNIQYLFTKVAKEQKLKVIRIGDKSEQEIIDDIIKSL